METGSEPATHRNTVTELQLDELDAQLVVIRERRLARVRQIEQIAKVKAEKASLVMLAKFQRALERAQKALGKLDIEEQRVAGLVNKARAMYMEVSDD